MSDRKDLINSINYRLESLHEHFLDANDDIDGYLKVSGPFTQALLNLSAIDSKAMIALKEIKMFVMTTNDIQPRCVDMLLQKCEEGLDENE
jgi:hypothetical protein